MKALLDWTGRLLARASTLRAAAGFGVSGAAFAIGNLLLARVMPVAEYGQYSLAVALISVCGVVAPLGFDEVSVRHDIRPTRRLLARVLASGLLVALGVMVAAWLLYRMPLPFLPLIGLSVIGGGISAVVSAMFRRRHNQGAALLQSNIPNWTVLTAGTLALFLPLRSATALLAFLAAGVLAGAAFGWFQARRTSPDGAGEEAAGHAREALSFLGVVSAGALTLQLERLVLPSLLGLHALATFAVLATVAIFPFRMLRAGIGFSLAPRLRATTDIPVRRRLVRHELLVMTAVLSVATLGILLVAPVVTTHLTNGRYDLGFALVLAACGNGALKVVAMLPRAVVSASGSRRDIATLNRLGWLGVLTSLAGAVLGAWAGGLPGLIWGCGLGSLAGAAPAATLARRTLAAAPGEMPFHT